MRVDEELTGLVYGLKCTEVTAFETGQWRFQFGPTFVLDVFSPWRIVSKKTIELGGADDKQKFGLSARIDGVAEATRLLAGGLVSAEIRENSGDIFLECESGLLFETLNDCSGDEAWTCHAGGLNIVGVCGGHITVFRAQ